MNTNDTNLHGTAALDAEMVRRLDRLAAAERASAPAGFEDRIASATMAPTHEPRLVGEPAPNRTDPRAGGWNVYTPMRAAAVLALAGALLAVLASHKPASEPVIMANAEPVVKSPADDWLLVSSVLDEGTIGTEMKSLLSDASRLSTRLDEPSDWFLSEGSM